VPEWARAALPGLPEVMAAATRRANALERAVVDAAEAVVLAPRVGERFAAVVVESGPKGAVVQLQEPPVRARCEGADLPLGETVEVELVAADPATREVRLRRV
jgi:exoribonuclease R